MPADLHPNLRALTPLLGTWQGRGTGEYPTIEPFEYLEEVTFAHVGKPFLVYGQKTTDAASGAPLHAETGYLRVPCPGDVELVLAHPSGITEIEVGSYTVDGGTVALETVTTKVGLTPTAKEVTSLGRRLRVNGDELSYSLQMQAVGQPLQHHLSAVLHRNAANR
jgi:hypothetical protein